MSPAGVLPAGDARRQAGAWLASGVLHAALVGGAVLVMSHATLPQPPEVFRWEIAVVTPSGSVADTAPVERRVEPPPVPEPVASPPAVVRAVTAPAVVERKPSRVVAAAPAATTRARAPSPTIVTRTVPPAEVIEATRPEPAPRSVRTEVARPAAPREVSVPEPRAQRVQVAADAVAERPAPTETIPVPAPSVAHLREVRARTGPVTTPRESPAREAEAVIERRPASTVVARAAMPVPEVRPTASASVREAASEPPSRIVPAETTQVAAATRATRLPPAPRPDFGWVASAVWTRVAQLKRYPHQARINRWEGTVVMRAVIRHDGTLVDVTLEQSSGHQLLDEDAMALLRLASPLELEYELGRPQLAIRIPITYELE